jgi:hypothetical protein
MSNKKAFSEKVGRLGYPNNPNPEDGAHLLFENAAQDNMYNTTYLQLIADLTVKLGSVRYAGTWDASINNPTITSGVGSTGEYYIVSTGGNINIDGNNDWKASDWIIFNGFKWEKVDNTSEVQSVFGRVGGVTAESGDYNASQITNSAVGNITAENLQAALTNINTLLNGKENSFSKNTGFNLPKQSSYTVNNDNQVATAGAVYALYNWVNSTKLKPKVSIEYAGRFDGSSSQYLVDNNPDVYIYWDGTNKQFRYYPRTDWGWHDAGIVLHKGTSVSVSTNDISGSYNDWYYFTNGSLDTTFNIVNYGNFGTCHITQENNSGKPSYRIEFQCGKTGSITAIIYKILS